MRCLLVLSLVAMVFGICGCDDAKHREMEMQVAILKDRNEQLKADNEKLKDGLDSAKEQIDSLQDEMKKLKEKQSKLDEAIATGTETIKNVQDFKDLLSPELLEKAAAALNAGKELDLPEFDGVDAKQAIKNFFENRKKAREARQEERDKESGDE